MNVTLEKIVPENDYISTFHFRPEKPLHYTAGQFIELTVPHDNPDERGTQHWFTLSSSPAEELLTITTRFSQPSSTFKQALFALEPGAVLHMSDAMGDFVLPKLIQTPLVFVAGGIGITPFRSILNWLGETGEERPIRLLYAVNKEDDILFQDVFDKAGVHASIVVSEPSDAWGGERGRLNAEMILGLEKPSDDTLMYLSGPEPMVEQLANDLKSQGVNKQQLVTDMFPNYSKNY